MTPEEKVEIASMVFNRVKVELLDMVIEKVYLKLPELAGNLVLENANMLKLNQKFYKDHPEFKGNESVVRSVIEMMEGEDPTSSYVELIEKAPIEIKKRLKTLEGIDTKKIDSNPSRDFPQIAPPSSEHGEI